MRKEVYYEVEVDHCTNCRGFWFGRDEMDRLLKWDGIETIDDGDPKTGKLYNKVKDIRCPVCAEAMHTVSDPDQPHIEFEHCDKCGGSFLDAGEFADLKRHTLSDFFRDMWARHQRRK